MNEQKIKIMLNREVLEGITDYTARNILKSILFSQSNSIDWEQAYTLTMTFMPELVKYEGYSVENMR